MISASKIYTSPDALGLGNHVTHLGIGAHADDLEFMALEGILSCYEGRGSFAGVTCTDGRGSSRTGRFADVSDDDMVRVRADEQNRAADLGRYAAMVQLGHPSAVVKSAASREPLVLELLEILTSCCPETVYTHNLADKHPSHTGVALAAVEAVRRMPETHRPARLLGCEVWRSLDWIGDGERVAMDVGGKGKLAATLAEVFESQIAGGKRYDLAVAGRRRANATFSNPHAIDQMEEVWYAMDLTPLAKDIELDISEYVLGYIDRFREDVASAIADQI